MKDRSLEQRVADLEELALHAQAAAAFQAAATASLAEWLLDATSAPDLYARYREMVRARCEVLLSTLSDDDPGIASALRDILKSQLDAPSKP
ncbi:MAG: hypothetical protein H0X40_15585 [Chthoniobacterales bacterium]|nr:hypothetical protein [Chthoniobacterales bacterium]